MTEDFASFSRLYRPLRTEDFASFLRQDVTNSSHFFLSPMSLSKTRVWEQRSPSLFTQTLKIEPGIHPHMQYMPSQTYMMKVA
jgi:hypothetical protein